MQAGRLRHRVTIQAATITQDSRGQTVETWADVVTVWARCRQVSGREATLARQLHAEAEWRIDMRFRTGVTTQHRLVHGAHTLEILSLIDPDNRKRELTILAKESTLDG